MEAKIASLDILERELTDVKETVTFLSRENASLRSRLDEFEDRSRRDNLIFYGVPDSNSETWAVSESKVRDIIANEMKIIVPPEGIIRAHRLGRVFNPSKCRPVLVKFSLFKTKDHVFSSRGKLRGSATSVAEDFSPATRLARRKLLEFAKAHTQSFSLRYNKVFFDDKCFSYCAASDAVCEVRDFITASTSSIRVNADPVVDLSTSSQ